MKKRLTTLLFIFLIFGKTYSQLKSNYARGFEIGFEEGYCYNNETVDCFRPITPLAPLPRINENKENYTQGYNRGFQYGLDLKRSEEAFNQPNINLHNRLVQFNEYVSQQPVSAMIAVGMLKQEKYDARKEWMSARMGVIKNLLFNLYREIPGGSSAIENEKNFLIERLNPYTRADLANDNQFRIIQNIFYESEKKIYSNYNTIVELNKRELKKQQANKRNAQDNLDLNQTAPNKFSSNFLEKNKGHYCCTVYTYKLTDNKYALIKQEQGYIGVFDSLTAYNNDVPDCNKDITVQAVRYFQNEEFDQENLNFIYNTEYGNVVVDLDFTQVSFYDISKKNLWIYVIKNKLKD